MRPSPLCAGRHSARTTQGRLTTPSLPGRQNIRYVAQSPEGRHGSGPGCFKGIRNPAAHEDGLSLSEQVALEQLADCRGTDRVSQDRHARVQTLSR